MEDTSATSAFRSTTPQPFSSSMVSILFDFLQQAFRHLSTNYSCLYAEKWMLKAKSDVLQVTSINFLWCFHTQRLIFDSRFYNSHVTNSYKLNCPLQLSSRSAASYKVINSVREYIRKAELLQCFRQCFSVPP